MSEQPLESLIGLDKASRVFGVSYWTFRDWAREGKVPFIKVGKKYMFRESELRQVMEQNRGGVCLTK